MSTFNKVIAVLGLLVLFVLLPVIAAIPEETLDLLRGALAGATVVTTGARVATLVVSVVLWVAVVVLLWLEFRSSRSGMVRVAAVEGGVALVQARSVERRLEQALLSLPSVQAARARVNQTRNGVVAALVIDTDADVNVPAVTSSAIGQARYLLEKEVGVTVGRVDVRVRHVTPKQGRAPRSAAQVPARPPAAERPVVPEGPADLMGVPSARPTAAPPAYEPAGRWSATVQETEISSAAAVQPAPPVAPAVGEVAAPPPAETVSEAAAHPAAGPEPEEPCVPASEEAVTEAPQEGAEAQGERQAPDWCSQCEDVEPPATQQDADSGCEATSL